MFVCLFVWVGAGIHSLTDPPPLAYTPIERPRGGGDEEFELKKEKAAADGQDDHHHQYGATLEVVKWGGT